QPVSPLEGMEKRFGADRIVYAQGSTLVDGFAVPIPSTALWIKRGPGRMPRHGLGAEFFANTTFSGNIVTSRVDREVNFNWDKFPPVAGVERNNYSVRWI